MHTLVIEKTFKKRVVALAALVAFFTLAIVWSVSASTTGTLSPTSDGTYTQWTPSTGASHVALVDESICNGTTDYNSTTGVGNRDSYTVSLASVPDGATISQIDIKPCASRVSGGGTNPVMNVFYRVHGVNSANGGAYSLTGTTPIELATTTFSSLAITKSSTSTLEIGAILSSSTKGARLSRIITNLTYTALFAPTTLAGGSTTSSSTRLTWIDTSSNELGFAVERSMDAINWTSIATTTANATSYTDGGLSALTTYYHRVRAFNSGAYTSYTNVATTTTTDVPPNAPSSLTLSSAPGMGTTTDITLNWADNSSNELNFRVERSTGGAYTQIATTSADAIMYTDFSRTTGTHSYRVRAYNLGGNSAYSNVASTTIP